MRKKVTINPGKVRKAPINLVRGNMVWMLLSKIITI